MVTVNGHLRDQPLARRLMKGSPSAWENSRTRELGDLCEELGKAAAHGGVTTVEASLRRVS